MVLAAMVRGRYEQSECSGEKWQQRQEQSVGCKNVHLPYLALDISECWERELCMQKFKLNY